MKKKVPATKAMKPMKKMPKGTSKGRSSKVGTATKPVGIPRMMKGYAK